MIIAISMLLALSDPLDAYDRNGEDIIPAAFQGSWAPSTSGCNDEDGVDSVRIDSNSVTAYDFRAKLIKHAGANTAFTTDERLADSLVMLVAQSGGGDVDITRYRLSILDNKLYVDFSNDFKKPFNPNVGGHVRCPEATK